MLDGEYIVFLPDHSNPVRVTGNVAHVLPALQEGADRGQISKELTEFHGHEVSLRQSDRLIAALRERNMFKDQNEGEKEPVIWLGDVGAAVERFGLIRIRFALGTLSTIGVLVAAYFIMTLVLSGNLKNPFSLFFDLNWLPFLLLLLIALPVHELGHIVAGISSNTSLGRLGLNRRTLPIIKPFVESLSRKNGDDSLPLAATAAGGPLGDVTSAGIAACVAVAGPGWLQPTASGFCALALIMAYQNFSI